jgi:signal transduction histidine kinase
MERRRQGIKEDHEFEFITKEGDRIYTALATAPITDDDGVYKGALAVVSDITERKRAKDALLRVNQKLNVLSQLTRKDLTCQIFVLNSYLEITKKNAAGQDHILEGIQKCEKAILSISEITEFTKDFQDMGAKPPKWQNVKMALLFGLSHISIINIQHSLETENLEIFADPLLEKVCQRLFENSVKHGGHVSLIRVSHTITPDSVTIVFEDDGVGISAEKKEQIFLRGEGPRASMRSLFFVREILDITGIIIKETGEPGKGARFEITVPKGAWRTAGGDN